jgi:hypothetical protein
VWRTFDFVCKREKKISRLDKTKIPTKKKNESAISCADIKKIYLCLRGGMLSRAAVLAMSDDDGDDDGDGEEKKKPTKQKRKKTSGVGCRKVAAVVEAARVTPSGTLVVFEEDAKCTRVRQREKRVHIAGPKKKRQRAPNSRPTAAKPGAKRAKPGTKRPRRSTKKKTDKQKLANVAYAAIVSAATPQPSSSDEDTEDEEVNIPEDVKERIAVSVLAVGGGGGGVDGGGGDDDSEQELEECDDEQTETIIESRQRRFAPRVGRTRITLAQITRERVEFCQGASPPPLALDVMSYVAEVFLFLDEACRLASTCVGYHRVARDFMRRMVWCCMPVMDRMCVGANKCQHNFARPSGEIRKLPEFSTKPKLALLLTAIHAGERPPEDGANACGCKCRPFLPLFTLDDDNAGRFVPSNDTYRCTCLTQQPYGLAPPDPRHSVWCYSIPEETKYVRLTPALANDHQRFLHILALLRRNMAELGPLSNTHSYHSTSSSSSSSSSSSRSSSSSSSSPSSYFTGSSLPSSSSSTLSFSSTSLSPSLSLSSRNSTATRNVVTRILRRARNYNVVAPRIVVCTSFDVWLRRVNLAHNVFSSCWMSADGVWFQTNRSANPT